MAQELRSSVVIVLDALRLYGTDNTQTWEVAFQHTFAKRLSCQTLVAPMPALAQVRPPAFDYNRPIIGKGSYCFQRST